MRLTIFVPLSLITVGFAGCQADKPVVPAASDAVLVTAATTSGVTLKNSSKPVFWNGTVVHSAPPAARYPSAQRFRAMRWT